MSGVYIPKDQRHTDFTLHIRPTDTTIGSLFVKCATGEESQPEYTFFVSESDSVEKRTENFIKNMLEIWQQSFICKERVAAAVEEILNTMEKGNV